jgi:hypothetical protein
LVDVHAKHVPSVVSQAGVTGVPLQSASDVQGVCTKSASTK